MEVVFLGTSAMVPTRQRNHPGVLLKYNGEYILIDCGENIQRQLRLAEISPMKITKLFITHWHGDHTLGIPGLMQALSVGDYSRELLIFGPRHSNLFMQRITSAFLLEGKIRYRVKEARGLFFENDDYILEALALQHTAPCLAFSFIEKDKRNIDIDYVRKFGLVKDPLLGELQRGRDIVYKGKKIKVEDATVIKKGKKITYITDTLYTKNCLKAARNADLLICEATFGKDLEGKAMKYQHLTAEQSALLAMRANVKRLVLTHFSQRYRSTKLLEKEAKKIFQNTVCAKDFMRIIV